MFKKMMLLAVAAMAVVAVVAPAAASANWTDSGVPLASGENPHILLEGPWKYESEFGLVSCTEATATVQLTGGTIDAHIKSFTVDNPQGCTVGGLLAALCGTHSLTAANLTQEGTATVAGGTLEWSEVSLITEFGSCAAILLTDAEEGSLTATPNNKSAISSLMVSGELEDNAGGVQSYSSTLKVTPQGRYGIE
jgi:hypothetical protein